jgi:SapC
MATVPQAAQLPMFYNDLMPLSSSEHGGWRARSTDRASWLVNQHAIPLTVEEFPLAQRNFPIVFSTGENSVPLALMGMNEGVNVFVEEDGSVRDGIYIPAYARRYPFMLARLRPDTEDLSLCFDPTSDLVGAFDDGLALFEGDLPSDSCKSTLAFCEQFEIAGQKTASFVEELEKPGLLIDGELQLGVAGSDTPFTYKGFRMVDENKLKGLRGDLLRTWANNGILPLIYAHLFSLDLVRDIFMRQVQLGKGPVAAPEGNA